MLEIIYANSIIDKRLNRKTGKAWVFDNVPPKLKPDVAQYLIHTANRSDLVPAEFRTAAD